jgi:hypothetical protein
LNTIPQPPHANKIERMKKLLFILIFPLVLFSSCKEEIPEIGDPFLVADGLIGEWRVSGVEVVDLLTINVRSGDITDFYVTATAGASRITFNDENGARSFSLQWTEGVNFITGPGVNAPTTGTWELDAELQTTKILLKDNGGQLISILNLEESVKSFSQFLSVSVDQFCDDDAVHAYSFTFQRTSN